MARMRAMIWMKRKFAAMLLKTGQTTCYMVGDDGDVEAGVAKGYTVLSTGQYSGNTNIEVAHYAANTIAFVSATKKITDSANGLATVLTGDTIVVKGSSNNDGTYTVATGGVAGEIVVNEALTDEAASAYISLYKRVSHSNNAVQDDKTGLMWARYTSSGEKVGAASDGKLVWYDANKVYTLHPAAADLQMIASSNTLRIVGGSGEEDRYHVGDLLDCDGFANDDNNRPGHYVVSVTVNGSDLDIVLDPGNETLVNEAAGGSRSIGLVCQSIFNYAAGARAAGLGSQTDWRVPNDTELDSLRNMELPNAVPDAVAFPGWVAGWHWTANTRPDVVAQALALTSLSAQVSGIAKTSPRRTALVRG